MKTNKNRNHQLRQLLDQKISHISFPIMPKNGWLKSVRIALGLTYRGLGELLGVAQNSIHQFEENEMSKKITLEKLSQAAKAMDCELVYAFVPKSEYKTFDSILESKSLEYAKKIFNGVSHSMSLEKQNVNEMSDHYQIKNLAAELKQDLDFRIWINDSMKNSTNYKKRK